MPTLNPGAPAGKVFTSDKSGWALHPLWGNEVDLLYGGDCSVKTSLESGWWVDNMFSGRTEHSLVPFQRGISPHLIWGWETCKVKKIWFLEAKSPFSTMLARYPPYGPFSLQGEGKTGVPGIDLAIPGALSYHHCNCYILCYIHTCILYVHHQECALGRRGLSRCPRGWAGARTMLTTTQSGHLLMQTLLKIRTHKNTSHHHNWRRPSKMDLEPFGTHMNYEWY